jgi:guanylate kinase
VTTRGRRENEIEDVHYHFISDAEYDKLLAEDAFIEHASVHGNRYGTLKSEVYDRMEKGLNVLLDIDPQGAREVMSKEENCVSVFILPPSYHDLKVRLHTRNTENEEEIQRRLNNARGEIRQMNKYRYLVVNDNLELAFEQLSAIVRAEKQNTVRYFPEIEE